MGNSNSTCCCNNEESKVQDSNPQMIKLKQPRLSQPYLEEADLVCYQVGESPMVSSTRRKDEPSEKNKREDHLYFIEGQAKENDGSLLEDSKLPFNSSLNYQVIKGSETIHPAVKTKFEKLGPFGLVIPPSSNDSRKSRESAGIFGLISQGEIQTNQPTSISWNKEEKNGRFTLQSSQGNLADLEGRNQESENWNEPQSLQPIIYPDGSLYEGGVHGGLRHGLGRLILPSGSFLEAQWERDLPKAPVYLVCRDKTVFKGKVNNQYQMHGFGEAKRPDGSLYQGNFINGFPDNECQVILPNGDKYFGELLGWELTGTGELDYKDGSKYSGRVFRGLKQGKGSLTATDGSVYTGNFSKDLPEGHGQMIWPEEGKKYIGQWKDGLMHGKGSAFKNEVEIQGYWNAGQMKSEPVSYMNSSRSATSFIANLNN